MPSTVSHSGRSRNRCLLPVMTSANGLSLKGAAAPDAGTRVIFRLVRKPATETPSVTIQIFQASSFHEQNKSAPMAVLDTAAKDGLHPRAAVARHKPFCGRISGTMPYIALLNLLACKAT